MFNLTTVDLVIEALGGNAAASKLTGVSVQAVSNWKSRGSIPPYHLIVISSAIGTARLDPVVFGFKSQEAAE
jgi:DNA-binding transcriptional regulator YdaS (Cro superfamily)